MALEESCLFSLNKGAVVSVVDDDASIRKSLKRLLTSLGLETKTFPSAVEFLHQTTLQDYGCIIADVRMPEMNGLDMQRKMISRGIKLPLIFITAYVDPSVRTAALEAGAIDFLQKPFSELSLQLAICSALEKSSQRQ